ncbi:MAG: hypothetical protein ABI597_05945 [Gammaproteobacteria bacterium]
MHSNQSQPSKIEFSSLEQHYKARLEKRLLAPIRQAHNVTIREIVITQCDLPNNDNNGEFNVMGNAIIPGKKITYSEETNVELLDRVMEQIQQLAGIGTQRHLQDNFLFESKALNAKPVVESDCKNSITRVSTNEFFFYPAAERGPFTEKVFGQLIKRIEALAKKLPENLHLALGTFPVENNHREIHCVAIYIQAGSLPRIDVISKAFPSRRDPDYPKTTTVFYTGNTTGESLASAVKKATKLISSTEPDNVTVEQIEELIALCDTNLEYPAPNDLKMLLNHFLARLENQNLSNNQISVELSEITQLSFQYAADIKKAAGDNRQKAEAARDQLPNFAKTVFQPQIIGVTANGSRFGITFEICLDHGNQTGKIALERDFNNAQRNGSGALTLYATQLVTSNIVKLRIKGHVTQYAFITHTDFSAPGIKHFTGPLDVQQKLLAPEEKKRWASAFCTTINIHVYKRMSIDGLITELRDRINVYHEFMLALEACRFARIQNPWDQKRLTQKITKLIHTNLLSNLGALDLRLFESSIFNYYLVCSANIKEINLAAPNCRKEILKHLNMGIATLQQNHEAKGASQLLSVLTMSQNLLLKDIEDKNKIPVIDTETTPIDFKRHQGKHSQYFFLNTAGAVIKQLMKQNEITWYEGIIITSHDFFLELINKGIIGVKDISFMKTVAKFLLNEPEAFQHVFSLIKNLGKEKFSALNLVEKELLFKLPVETYRSGLQKKLLTLEIYLAYSIQERRRVTSACEQLNNPGMLAVLQGHQLSAQKFISYPEEQRQPTYGPSLQIKTSKQTPS